MEESNNVNREDFEKFDGLDFSPAELKRMKAMMNIGQRKKTKKYATDAQRKSKRSMQKASRKANRK